LNGRPHLLCRGRCTGATEDGALRWAILVAGDLLSACLAYLGGSYAADAAGGF